MNNPPISMQYNVIHKLFYRITKVGRTHRLFVFPGTPHLHPHEYLLIHYWSNHLSAWLYLSGIIQLNLIGQVSSIPTGGQNQTTWVMGFTWVRLFSYTSSEKWAPYWLVVKFSLKSSTILTSGQNQTTWCWALLEWWLFNQKEFASTTYAVPNQLQD